MKDTTAVFEIKSTRMDVLVVELKSADVDAINTALYQRFNNMTDAASVPLLLDLSLFRTPADVEIQKMFSVFRHYGLNVVGIRHSDKQFGVLARASKLAFNLKTNKLPSTVISDPISDFPILNRQVGKIPGNNNSSADVISRVVINQKGEKEEKTVESVSSKEQKEPVLETSREKTPVKVPASLSSSAMVVRKPVRTGQQVYAKNRDLIVLDLVSPGAEVLADGNIHIYAPLRGRAIAGVNGNREARIFTQCMQAELVAIAGLYRTIDQRLPAEIANAPAQIYIEQDKLVIKALK